MLSRRALLLLFCWLAVVITGGCTTPRVTTRQTLHTHPKETEYTEDGLDDTLRRLIATLDQLGINAVGLGGQDRLVRRYTGGRSVENRPLEYLVMGQGQDVILILATIHGNEPAGTPLVLQLAGYLREHPLMLQGRTVVVVPVANPDGIIHNQRFNANGVDLNRNFEAANRQDGRKFGSRALSEPESRFIHLLIDEYKPDRIISIHQPLSCIDYDGPAKALAECLAGYCKLPIRKLGARPGSLGSYAGETLGIPIVTFELPRGAHELAVHSLWDKYGNALVAAVLYPNLAK